LPNLKKNMTFLIWIFLHIREVLYLAGITPLIIFGGLYTIVLCKMNRKCFKEVTVQCRSFLRWLLASLGLVGSSRKTTSDFGLGKYISHMVESNYSYLDMLNGNRIILWPIEVILTIKYTNGHEVYTTFNLSKEWICKVNEMNVERLMSYRINKG